MQSIFNLFCCAFESIYFVLYFPFPLHLFPKHLTRPRVKQMAGSCFQEDVLRGVGARGNDELLGLWTGRDNQARDVGSSKLGMPF